MAKSSIVVDSCQRLPLLRPVIIWNCGDKNESVTLKYAGQDTNIKLWGDFSLC